MTTILDLPEVRELVPRLSVEEYHRLGELGAIERRTELVRGIIIKKVSKSPLHSSISKRLYDRVLALAPDGYSVWRDDPLTFIDSEPEPDLCVVSGLESHFTEAHPRTAELVVEVAVTSAALDRANASLYAENGVKEYWIVVAAKKELEIHRKPQDRLYRERVVLHGDAVAQCQHLPQIAIPLADIF